MTPEFQFDMVAEPTETSVAGLIATGHERAELHQKLSTRANHYAGLMLAIGDSWTAVTTGSEEAPLPWLSQPPMFLYPLGPGGFCQMGYRPNVPSNLHASLIAKLRRQFAAKGAIALTADQLFDFSESRQLSDVDLRGLA